MSSPGNGRTGFTRLPASTTGIAFTNHLAAQSAANNRILENGSGVALGDVDGDGRCDVYLCRLEGPNALYRNLGGWRFEEVAARAGVECAGQANTGAAFADVDGDGDLDLLVNGIGAGTRLFLNDGAGRFTESTRNRLSRRHGATSLALADIDGDGDLDLYVPNYRTTTFKDDPPGLRVEARRLPDGRVAVSPEDRFIALGAREAGVEVIERGERDFLYLNRGGGDFAPVSWTAGTFLDEDGRPLTAPPTDWGLSAMFRDIDGDGWPDLYVCNDFVYWPDRVWLNRRGAGFAAAPRTWLRSQSLSSMSVDFADIDRDGLDDIFVAEMTSRDPVRRAWQRPNTMATTLDPPLRDPAYRPEVTRNTLHLARPGGAYAEIAQFAGVAATEWTWSGVFLDVDLDGWEDLLVANGNLHDVQHADVLAAQSANREPPSPQQRLRSLSRFPPLATANLAFRNRRDRAFEETGAAWGFADVGVTTALALADLDGDGDLDVVANNLDAEAWAYRNDSPAPRVAVRLRGAGANTRGVGARIRVSGGPVTQSQEMTAGGRYLSGDDAMRVFAAPAGGAVAVEVRWPRGGTTRVDNVPAGFLVEVAEPDAATAAAEPAPAPSSLFEDVSDRLGHVHAPTPFDDFARQPLLPRRLSTEGPGVMWVDLDADGLDDLVIGGEGVPVVFRNTRGKFERWPERTPKALGSRMSTGLAAHMHGAGVRMILGQSNWRDGQPDVPAGTVAGVDGVVGLPAMTASAGALALADFDRDGFPDLAVAGRAVAGQWPRAADTVVFRGGAGGFAPWTVMREAGLVTGMIATDLDGDGAPELVLAREWGPIGVFRWDGTTFVARDPEVSLPEGRTERLSSLAGLWSGLAAADFDGDGQLDLLAGNRGWNFGEGRIDPRRDAVALFHGDFGLGAARHALMASAASGDGPWVPWRELSAVRQALPFVAETSPTHEAYGRAGLPRLLGAHAAAAGRLEARWFATTLFLNRGGRLEARLLPAEAQFAPAFGVCAADFDGDGRMDAFLSQNDFGVDAETSRQDAGLGLVLVGDGAGGLRALSPAASGVAITGEGRGAAVADFDGDGRVDLAVAQQGGRTVLLRNATARPGWPVRLEMPGPNASAVGAVVRGEFAGRPGPALEVRAGNGWWSQDSPRLILTGPSRPDAVIVRWPDGPESRHAWPVGAGEFRPRHP